MIGSWAGAMGHTQWMPEVWLHLGVDYDGDGKISPFGPPDDALASTARYFVERGKYRRGEHWGYEVRLPAGVAGHASRSYADWQKRGVVRADGEPFPQPNAKARLWVPVPGGPAFLIGPNFFAVKSYNPSMTYTLALVHLGDLLRGGAFVQRFPGSEPAPTLAEVQEIQRRLTALGFDTGGADGRVGTDTMLAVRDYQRKVDIEPADGYAGIACSPACVKARDPVRSRPTKTGMRGTPPMTPPKSATARHPEQPAGADTSIGALERPTPAGVNAPGFGSDVVAETLRALDIPYIAVTPGASYRGLHDSIVNYLGNTTPQMLLCVHEESAVAIAHGYAKVTGKAMAAAVHSNVGLQHATMAMFNAWCDRMPMLVLGATGPVDAMKRRPWIDWIHTARDQGALIRDYTKWDDQPASPGAAREALMRGTWIANTAPQGPVYINLDAEMQEAKLAEPLPPIDAARYMPPIATAAPADLVRQGRGDAEIGQAGRDPGGPRLAQRAMPGTRASRSRKRSTPASSPI